MNSVFKELLKINAYNVGLTQAQLDKLYNTLNELSDNVIKHNGQTYYVHEPIGSIIKLFESRISTLEKQLNELQIKSGATDYTQKKTIQCTILKEISTH